MNKNPWFQTPNSFVLTDLRKIKTLGELKVLTVLRYFTNRGTGDAWPSLKTLAELCGLSRRNVSRAIQRLMDHGFLSRSFSGSRSSGETTHYSILIPSGAHDPSGAEVPRDVQDQPSGAHDPSLGAQVTKPRGACAPQSDDEQTIYQTKEQTRGANGDLAGEGSLSGFERFWSKYPFASRSAADKCRGIWNKKNLDGIADEVLAGLKAWKQSDRWTKDNGRYVKNSAGWLEDELWRSPPEPPADNGITAENWQAMGLAPDRNPTEDDFRLMQELDQHRDADGAADTKAKLPHADLIPPTLDTPAFYEAWGKYAQHRKEIHKKLTPTAAKLSLKDLEAMGSDRAVAAIKRSIANGWQGIFEDKGTSHARNGKSTRLAENLQL